MINLELIKNKIEQLGISPIYFIGSGISRRYFEAPDFKNLLSLIRTDWERSFEHYLQKHGSVYPQLAQELSEMYFDKVEDNDLEAGKDKNYYIKKRVSDLLQNLFEEKKSNLETNNEIHFLKQTSPSAIITTNYDPLLENIFPQYESFIGQESLLSQNVNAVGEIYKIHGCLSIPESIVITQTDYDHFSKKQQFLNAKLMTLFLEYPIIIMGYSLEDENIKSILADIIKMLPIEKVSELAERIFFIKRSDRADDYNKTERFSLNDGLYIDLQVFYLNDYSHLYQAIISTKVQKLPINFLRYLKANIYKLTASQEYDPKLLDVNIVDLERIDKFDLIHNMIGLTFTTTQKGTLEFLDNKGIILPVLQQEPLCLYVDSVIRYLAIENQRNLPIHYYKQLKGGDQQFIEWLNHRQDIRVENKKVLISKIGTYKDYSALMGRAFHFNANELKKLVLDIKSIEEYKNEYCNSNEVPTSSHTTVLKRLLFNLCLIRMDDILNNDSFINSTREFLLVCISNLPKDFVVKNKGQILNLMKKLDIQQYDASFRKAICQIDQYLYSDLAPPVFSRRVARKPT